MISVEECLIGVPHLDAQHKSLFSIIDRIKGILQENDDERHRRLCKEALKFLELHTSRHFEDEEAYMRSIHCPTYEQHIAQHKAIVETLTSFKDDLIASDFAPHAVKNIMGTMLAWLTYHTIEVDSMICKGVPHIDHSNCAAVAMEKAVSRIVSEVFRESVELVNGSYTGIPDGSHICYATQCSHPDGRRFLMALVVNDQVVLHTINLLFSTEQTCIDETALSAVKELGALLFIHFLQNYQDGAQFHIDQNAVIDQSQLQEIESEHTTLCSLLFGSTYGGVLIRVWSV